MYSVTFLNTRNYEFSFRDFLSCSSGFFLGCIIAYLEERLYIVRPNIVLPKYLSFLVFIVIILFLIFRSEPVYDSIMYFLAAFLVFFLAVTRNGYLNQLLKWNFFTWLGTISYSIYMSHLCVIWIVNQFIRVVLNKSEIFINGQSVPQLSLFESFIALSSIILIVLTLSSLVYKFVENPLRLSSRSYAFKKFR